jgi:hypothetical protein
MSMLVATDRAHWIRRRWTRSASSTSPLLRWLISQDWVSILNHGLRHFYAP